MQRRKFIASVGSLAAGSAAAVGTGAFTSVTADRGLSIETAGDANAFLSITKAEDGDGNTYANAKEYVEIDNGQVSLDFTQADDNSFSSASGINKNAKTVFDRLLDVTNNGTQDVEFWIESDLVASNGGFLGIYSEDDDKGTGFDVDGSGNWGKVTLTPGETLEDIGVYIPAGVSPSEVQGGTITFKADSGN
ncbi:DUF1102 domain-containing protein [Halobaculum rubrum]|uniref:DUF1102 domain-containing protein n=1 Tax=Halobaculum rubrum TaxID=2872158 RepID=UPI001CA41B23|nr:DUF1102 domain-containing protein [Halobaculum rubrum]QZX98982.1 DUF1102 domain-containing protein [Halobaculum rubrum]